MIRRLISVGLALLLGNTTCAAYAWDNFGHMTVAQVCYQKLTPSVRARVNELVKLNPLYHEWEQQIDAKSDKDAQMFMLASVWADTINPNGT